jgi:hypothetical protein
MLGADQARQKAARDEVVATKENNQDPTVVLRFTEDGRPTQSVSMTFLGEFGRESAKFIIEVIDDQIQKGALLDRIAVGAGGGESVEFITKIIDEMESSRKRARKATAKKRNQLISEIIDDIGIEYSEEIARKAKKETVRKADAATQ